MLKSVAVASLVGSTLGEIIHITPITTFSNIPQPQTKSHHATCPLRVLRDSIRSQCAADVQGKCVITSSDFPLFISQQQQQQLSPLFSSGFVSFPPPPPSIGMVSLIDLESMIDEMFSSTLQIFDEAMSANRQEEVATERAVKAFEAKLPSFVEDIISSSSSSSSSVSSDEREIDNVPPQEEEEVFESLLGDLMDITSRFQINSERRRLSESENDPHLEMKDRLARRLTEYVSQTELFQLPGGGVMRVTSVRQVNETPKLGFGNVDVDECIYSSYKNGDLSSGCTMAVSSFMDFVNARRSGLERMVQQAPTQSSLPAPVVPPTQDVSLLQTLSQAHQRLKNEDDSNMKYMVYASILSSMLVVVSMCILAVKSIRLFVASVAMIAAAIFLGPVYMLAVLAIVFIVDQFFFIDDDDDDEEEDIAAVDFDYAKMEDDYDPVEANGQMDKPRVFIGVPVQVV